MGGGGGGGEEPSQAPGRDGDIMNPPLDRFFYGILYSSYSFLLVFLQSYFPFGGRHVVGRSLKLTS